MPNKKIDTACTFFLTIALLWALVSGIFLSDFKNCHCIVLVQHLNVTPGEKKNQYNKQETQGHNEFHIFKMTLGLIKSLEILDTMRFPVIILSHKMQNWVTKSKYSA